MPDPESTPQSTETPGQSVNPEAGHSPQVESLLSQAAMAEGAGDIETANALRQKAAAEQPVSGTNTYNAAPLGEIHGGNPVDPLAETHSVHTDNLTQPDGEAVRIPVTVHPETQTTTLVEDEKKAEVMAYAEKPTRDAQARANSDAQKMENDAKTQEGRDKYLLLEASNVRKQDAKTWGKFADYDGEKAGQQYDAEQLAPDPLSAGTSLMDKMTDYEPTAGPEETAGGTVAGGVAPEPDQRIPVKYEDTVKGPDGDTDPTTQQWRKENWVQEPEKAHAEGEAVDQEISEMAEHHGGVSQNEVENIATTTGTYAGKKYEVGKFDEHNPGESLDQKIADEHSAWRAGSKESDLKHKNRDTVIKFHKQFLEKLQSRGEPLSPNQEISKTLVAFIDKFGTYVYSKDGNAYSVNSTRENLTLERYPSDSDLFTGLKEHWTIEPWKMGELEPDNLLVTRPGLYGGIFYESTLTEDKEEDGFDDVRAVTTKQKFGLTRQEIDELKKTLDEFEVDPDPAMPPNFRR